MSVDKKTFWDEKILGWEEKKYSMPSGFLGRKFDVNSSLKKRLEIAQRILVNGAKDRVILEIGCGTARLFPDIIRAGAKKYIGVDISQIAIDRARAKAEQEFMSHCTEFYQADVLNLKDTQVDLCFSLGLLDWLELDEIRQMLSGIQCRYYFHSFSEKRRSVQQFIHKLYVYLLYGHRTKSYVPNYYTKTEMVDVFNSCFGTPPNCFRSNELSFGAFIYSLGKYKI